jgi:tripartite-type tricarboxylate transporter receptor subunit TctC
MNKIKYLRVFHLFEANPARQVSSTLVREAPEVKAALEKMAFDPQSAMPRKLAAFLATQLHNMLPFLRAACLSPVH